MNTYFINKYKELRRKKQKANYRSNVLNDIRETIARHLAIEQFAWLISDSFQDLVESHFDCIAIELEHVIADAVFLDHRIWVLDEFNIEKTASGSFTFSFVALTTFGNIPIKREVML